MRSLRVELEDGTDCEDMPVSSDMWSRLEGYCSLVENAMRYSFVQHAPSVKRIHWNQTTGWSVELESYSKEALAAALHVGRKLILQNEPYCFQNSQSLVRKAAHSSVVQSLMDGIRRQFFDGELSAYLQLYTGGSALLSDEAFRLWLNATEYHQDLGKQPAYLAVVSGLGSENSERLLVAQLAQRVFAFLRLYRAIGRSIRGPSA